jgi:hypothetical protein
MRIVLLLSIAQMSQNDFHYYAGSSPAQFLDQRVCMVDSLYLIFQNLG